MPSPTPLPEEREPPEGDEDRQSGEVVWQTLIQTIVFPFEKLSEGVRQALAELFRRTLEAALEPMKEAVDMAAAWLLPQDMMRDIRWKAWRAMARVAAALMPLALMITVGSAMREGVTSITGYAHAREALLNWLIGVGAAAASGFLIEKGIALSGAAAGAMRASLGQPIGEAWNLGDQLLGGIVNLWALQQAGPLMQLFLGFFTLVTMIVVVSSVILALLSREVILLLLSAVSPVIFLLGSMRPLRWLSGLWTKAMVVALLLGPVNLMLLTLFALLATQANAFTSGLGGTILGMLIGVGVVSVLVGLNAMIGKLVYGAAIEIAQKAWRSTMGVLQLAAVAAGFAVAPAAAGLLGGTSKTLATGPLISGDGTLPASGSTSSFGAGGSPPHLLSAAAPFGRSRDVNGLSRAIGSAMAGSRNPIVRGFGQGLHIAGAAEATRLPGPSLPLPPGEDAIDVPAGLQAAGEELTRRFAANESTAMARFGLPQAHAQGLIEEGLHVSGNAFAAMDSLGLPKGTTLRDLGYYRGGEIASAVAGFGRVTAGSWALRNQSPYSAPRPLAPPGPELGGHDLQAALEIVNGPVRAVGSIAATPEMLSRLARTVHQRRVQRGESLKVIVEEAARHPSRGELDAWMRDSYYNLPDRELARDLGLSLGILEEEDRPHEGT